MTSARAHGQIYWRSGTRCFARQGDDINDATRVEGVKFLFQGLSPGFREGAEFEGDRSGLALLFLKCKLDPACARARPEMGIKYLRIVGEVRPRRSNAAASSPLFAVHARPSNCPVWEAATGASEATRCMA